MTGQTITIELAIGEGVTPFGSRESLIAALRYTPEIATIDFGLGGGGDAQSSRTRSGTVFDLACSWESFWPLPDPLKTDRVPELDAGWLAARGIDPDAPRVLGCLRDEVLPLVRRLESERVLGWYAFLIHDCASGEPAAPDDPRSFVHLRFEMREGAVPQLPEGWLFTRRRPLPVEIAGIRTDALAGQDANAAWCLIGAQSEWVLTLVEQHKNADMLDLIKHARQFLHFFVNMTQMTAQ